MAIDIYKGLWQTIFGPNSDSSPTSLNAMVVNTDGSINVDVSTIVPPVGSTTIATGQVSVASTAGGTQIVAARTGRTDVTIVNAGTTDVWLGPSGLTTSTGILLVGIKGAAVTISTAAAVFGIVSSTAQTVDYLEAYS